MIIFINNFELFILTYFISVTFYHIIFIYKNLILLNNVISTSFRFFEIIN